MATTSLVRTFRTHSVRRLALGHAVRSVVQARPVRASPFRSLALKRGWLHPYPSRALTRVRMLLKADVGVEDAAIAQALKAALSTIHRVRHRIGFCNGARGQLKLR